MAWGNSYAPIGGGGGKTIANGGEVAFGPSQGPGSC